MVLNEVFQPFNHTVAAWWKLTSLNSTEGNLDTLGTQASQKPSLSGNAGNVLPDLTDVVPNTGEFSIQYQLACERLVVEIAGGDPDVVECVIEVAAVDEQERAFHVH